MSWLKVTNLRPGDSCPKCDRGTLYVRTSRAAGESFQTRWMWCSRCAATFKTLVDRAELRRRAGRDDQFAARKAM